MKTILQYGISRKLSVFAMTIAFMTIIVVPIKNAYAEGTNYYVGGTGASDSNPGTTTNPFATIQKAATIAVAGDTINIRTGTYRETITPANSGRGDIPIVYQPDRDAVVTVSGTDIIDGSWTVHRGHIYKKNITLPVNGYHLNITDNTSILANQVFKDGVMMFEARWPKLNTPEDLLDRSKVFRGRQSTSTFEPTTLTDNGLPDIPGGLVGAKISFAGWFIAQTRTISNHSSKTIEYPFTISDLRFLQYYFITGKLGLLTQEKEWHYESDTLYFWQPDGGNPTGVEYKTRNWGFDLRDKTNITIKGLQFFACEINGDEGSARTILDGIKAKYLNHSVMKEGSDIVYHNAMQTGIKLIGPNSIIRNSKLQYAASQAIWLGTNCIAENNLITDISYEGNYGSGVIPYGTTGGQVIRYNTIARTGRSAIDFGGINFGQHLNMEIGYNDIYDWGCLSTDASAIYGCRHTDLSGTIIHHNWIHDSRSEKTPIKEYEVGLNAGLYFDQATGPTTIHHNVLWNNYHCDVHNASYSVERSAGKSFLYNNTFLTDAGDDDYRARSYLTVTTQYFDVMRNNIFCDDAVIDWKIPVPGYGDVENCLMENKKPGFMNEGFSGLKYRLKPDSPAVDSGAVVNRITDGYVGTSPDIGAYEYGGTYWVPGYVSPD